MPSLDIPAQSFSVTAVAYGDLTVAANPGYNVNNLYSGLIGYIVGPGGTPASQRIVIEAVVSTGVIRCRVAPFEGVGGAGTSFNFAAYNGGNLTFEAQLATVASLYLDAGQIAGGDLGGSFPNPSVVSGANIVASTLPIATPLQPGAMSAADKAKVDNVPANTNASLALQADDYFVGTAGAGDLAANKLCYYAAASSTLLYAKADAIATARKIMGATTVAVTAGQQATLIRLRQARITVAAGCAPVIGAPAYLSGATAGCVYHAISGTIYPRKVGTFLEGAADGSSTVLVQLSLDDERDDERLWVIANDTLAAAASSISYATTRALWRELRIDCDLVGIAPGAASTDITYPSDMARGALVLIGDGPITSYSSGKINYMRVYNTGAGKKNMLKMVDTWLSGTMWDTNAESWANRAAQSALGWCTSKGAKDAPADAMALSTSGDLAFQIGTTVRISGKVRLP